MEKIEKQVLKKDTLISFVCSNFDISKNTANMLLRKKDIKVNNVKTNKNIILEIGDKVTIYLNQTKQKKIDIIYENENLAIIDKNYGVEITNTINSLDKKLGLIPVHRLDRNTTGLVIFAKNKNSKEILQKKINNNEIKKTYLAVVLGKTNYINYSPELYLFKDSKNNLSIVKDKKEKGYVQIKQLFNTIENFNFKGVDLSLVQIQIFTGKTHQIRASLKYLNHPILGDGKYGINKINTKLGFKYQLLNSNKIELDGKTYISNKNPMVYFT